MKLKDFRKDYNPYFDIYLNHLDNEENLFERLNKNHDYILSFFESIDEDIMKYAYHESKWSIHQILQHIIDTERIFCYRALKIVREKNPLIQSYNHDDYANTYKYYQKDIILKDYSNNRKASTSLYTTFDEFDLNKSVDNNHYKFNIGLIPFIFCGHELHHLEVIKKKYF